jgi:hypothetical protein
VLPTTERPKNEAEAIEWLVERVPELRPFLDEHVAFHDELLPYVVFESDFLRWFVKCVRAGNDAPAQRFVEAIEPLMTTTIKPACNDRVWNLAGVCFVEGLVMQGDDDVVERARPWMGPNTWEDVQHQFGYREGKSPPPARS